MVNFRRVKIPGGTYFFTVALRDRSAKTLVENIDVLRSAFSVVKRRMPYHIEAIVILPEHLHTIWTLPMGDGRYDLRWRRIKTIFTQSLRRSGLSVAADSRGECNIWQRRYWEHVIRDERDLFEHINYIHFNPVKHGLVDSPFEWPYSSLHRYIAEGRLQKKWGAKMVDVAGNFGE